MIRYERIRVEQFVWSVSKWNGRRVVKRWLFEQMIRIPFWNQGLTNFLKMSWPILKMSWPIYKENWNGHLIILMSRPFLWAVWSSYWVSHPMSIMVVSYFQWAIQFHSRVISYLRWVVQWSGWSSHLLQWLVQVHIDYLGYQQWIV